ncbi:hypothetical protein D046_4184B, partial [Vibrio parahaemolyticus V-223/04]
LQMLLVTVSFVSTKRVKRR